MIYLDYSANTPVDEAVLQRFCEVERNCPGNANSHHAAGTAAKAAIDAATQSIARSLNVQPAEIIYTSGASEANNFAIKSNRPAGAPPWQTHHFHPAGALLGERQPDRPAGAGL